MQRRCARPRRSAAGKSPRKGSAWRCCRRFPRAGTGPPSPAQADALERKQTIQRRLLRAFPGGYGQYLCLHFGRFLDEPVVGPEQQAAFAAVVDFLDRADFSLPPDLQALLDEAAGCWDAAFEQRAFANLNEMVADADAYLERHAESIAAYLQLRQSEAFRASPAWRLQEALARLQRETGYDTVFLPALERLSPSYRRYREGLSRADAAFRARFGDPEREKTDRK